MGELTVLKVVRISEDNHRRFVAGLRTLEGFDLRTYEGLLNMVLGREVWAYGDVLEVRITNIGAVAGDTEEQIGEAKVKSEEAEECQ